MKQDHEQAGGLVKGVLLQDYFAHTSPSPQICLLNLISSCKIFDAVKRFEQKAIQMCPEVLGFTQVQIVFLAALKVAHFAETVVANEAEEIGVY